MAKTPTAALPLRARVAAPINGQELVAQRPVPRRDSAKTLGLFEGDTYSPSQSGGQSAASHPKGAQTICRLRSKPVAFEKSRAFHQGDTGLLRNDSSGRGEPPSSPGNTEQRGGPVSFVPGSIASRSTRWIRNRENLGALGALGGFCLERAQTTWRLRRNKGGFAKATDKPWPSSLARHPASAIQHSSAIESATSQHDRRVESERQLTFPSDRPVLAGSTRWYRDRRSANLA